MGKPRHRKKRKDLATQTFEAGLEMLKAMPIFSLMHYIVVREKGNYCPEKGWAIVSCDGQIHTHPTRRGTPKEWVYVLAHCLLHLGFGHFRPQANDDLFFLWNVACDLYVARFLDQLKIGKPPLDVESDVNHLPTGSEEETFRRLLEGSYPDDWRHCGTTGPQGADMVMEQLDYRRWYGPLPDWPAQLGKGIALAVKTAVAETSHVVLDRQGNPAHVTLAEQARQWFISAYPLLGALAAEFKIVEDARICRGMEVRVAAVHPELQEIYINPGAGLSSGELRFVMAHELLHVGLRHDARIQGREPYLWNVACDYVINSWLIEMGVGQIPQVGGLYDEELAGLSAESIYDRIANDLRKYRRLSTLRGKGLGDILPPSRPEWWRSGNGIRLDDFYRSCLAQGLEFHYAQGRGFLPAGLVEEIRALSQPPIPWDVALARWFDVHFPALEKRRTYARLSRRQSATPDIPRPRWVVPEEAVDRRTFGVVLDTSGSMSRSLLAKALGAIASYAISRDVPQVRLVFCDATYYDEGYVAPETIADRVQVRGRGGTVLQPAVSFLERAKDFPQNGPLLIITDGYCGTIAVQGARPHAYLLPQGSTLPFRPRGEVFYVE